VASLMSDKQIDCRLEEGITVGLVDAIILICRVLAPRDLSDAKEALLDLASDEDFGVILKEIGLV